MESLMGALDKLAGFRLFLLLQGEDPRGRDVTAISVWDCAENMTSSENTAVYYETVKTVMACCESFSPMHEHEVLKTKLAHS
jgi:heme-degrading monooxygenase HmoA